MKMIATLALAASLSACATAPNLCAGADVRRAVYTSAVTAADAYAASGRPIPAEMMLGRQAAATALALLNARCGLSNTER